MNPRQNSKSSPLICFCSQESIKFRGLGILSKFSFSYDFCKITPILLVDVRKQSVRLLNWGRSVVPTDGKWF